MHHYLIILIVYPILFSWFQDLRPLFEKYGEIGDIYLPMDRESGRSRGFGFVRYHERRDAEVEIIDGRETDLPD